MEIKRHKDGKWVSGQTGNPSGRPVGTGYPKPIKKLTHGRLMQIMFKYMDYTIPQLKEAAEDINNTPAIEQMILNIIWESIRKKDPGRAEFLLNRTLGKVKDVVQLEGDKNTDLTKLSIEELHQLKSLLSKAGNENPDD